MTATYRPRRAKFRWGRAIVAAVLAVALLILFAALTGCSPPVQNEAEPSVEPTAAATTGGFDEGPLPEESESATPEPQDDAKFGDSYTYTDGLVVKVKKPTHGKLTPGEAEYSDHKAGTPYTLFTVTVKNGTKETVELSTYLSVYYGPNGEAADSSYEIERKPELSVSMSGKLPKGASRTITGAFYVPAKFRNNVILEVQYPTIDHESALFSGDTR